MAMGHALKRIDRANSTAAAAVFASPFRPINIGILAA
jgi:hypothetical protein